MGDIFISYAREDGTFVAQLESALVARDRDVWVDREAIPPTVEFMAEIRAGIESANVFVFVLSPASVRSRVAREELEHAMALNKRIVPILHQEVLSGEVPETVAGLNWILCRAEDDFDGAVASLIEAADTDFEWLRTHTRLGGAPASGTLRQQPESSVAG